MDSFHGCSGQSSKLHSYTIAVSRGRYLKLAYIPRSAIMWMTNVFTGRVSYKTQQRRQRGRWRVVCKHRHSRSFILVIKRVRT